MSDTPKTNRFPKSTNSFVTYAELRKSHEQLERELADAKEYIEGVEGQLRKANLAFSEALDKEAMAILTMIREEADEPMTSKTISHLIHKRIMFRNRK